MTPTRLWPRCGSYGTGALALLVAGACSGTPLDPSVLTLIDFFIQPKVSGQSEDMEMWLHDVGFYGGPASMSVTDATCPAVGGAGGAGGGP